MLQLEAFRKQKAEGKSKAPKAPRADVDPAAESPSPSKPLPPPPPLHQGSGIHAKQSNDSRVQVSAVPPDSSSIVTKTQQESAVGRGTAASLDSIPFSLSFSEEAQRSADAGSGPASNAARSAMSTPPSVAEAAVPGAASRGGQPAAAASSVPHTRPPALSDRTFSRGSLSGHLPAPPPLPLPPPPPHFNFRTSQAAPVAAPARDSAQKGPSNWSTERSQSSSGSSRSASGQLPVAPPVPQPAEAREETTSPEEHTLEKPKPEEKGEESRAKLERDPFGSLFRAAEPRQQSPPQLSSSETVLAGPSGLSPPPPAASALQPSAMPTLKQPTEYASPDREQQRDSTASAANKHSSASAETAPISDTVGTPAATGYAALSDGYLSPSRLEAAKPSPGRQQEPDQAEILPVSRSAGLNRLDSAFPAASSEAATTRSPPPQTLQGPSSSNGYSALSDGYIGRSTGGSDAAVTDRGHANGGLEPSERGWLGGASAGEKASDFAGKGGGTGAAGSSFADLFDAVLSERSAERKPFLFSPARSNVTGKAEASQEPQHPSRQSTSGTESLTQAARAWQQPTASLGTSGPPPPQPAAPIIDQASRGPEAFGSADTDTSSRTAPGGRSDISGPTSASNFKSDLNLNGGHGADPWGRPSPPPSSGGPRSVGPVSDDGGRARFAALQQHIDELTREKYELLRGMAGQRKVAETLEAENQAVMDDFNRQVQPGSQACPVSNSTASMAVDKEIAESV